MKHFFIELFGYSHHFNQKLCEHFISNESRVSEKSLSLFNHILNAQRVWNNRILPEQETYSVWQMHELHSLKSIDTTNFEHSLRIIEMHDLESVIHYSNTKGQAFSNSTQDILYHVINHSTYHRAQIATEFKQQGIQPLATDYIFYKR